jgi:rod shape-determining protein MreD
MQVASIGSAKTLGATPDLLLVVVLLIAWNKGSLAGAGSGFLGGLLVDVTALDHLGASALVLTLAGYWAGRYSETTGRGRVVAVYLAVAVLTVASGLALFLLHAVVGESVDAGRVLVPLLPGALVNVMLAVILHRGLRVVVGVAGRSAPTPEMDPVGS